jgi:hypothetical protein
MTGNGLVCVGSPRERLFLPVFVDSRDLVEDHLRRVNRFGGRIQVPGCRIDHNRNRVVEEFLSSERQAEWLLFLDNDMIFPAQLAERLVKRDKPVIGALYFMAGEIYDPIVYQLGRIKPDRYGRPTQMWTPMRDRVYDFLIANGIPSINKAMMLENVDEDSLLPCDGVGTGAMLIHRSVLETLSSPWFEFKGMEGEDLRFCKRVTDELGHQIYTDMSLICGHLDIIAQGHTQFMKAYEARGVQISNYSTEHAVEWLSNFFGEDPQVVMGKLQTYHPAMMGEVWKAFSPETADEVLAFYMDETVGEMYAYELIRWNTSDMFNMFRKNLVQYHDCHVLEIGGGVGSISIQMAFQGCDVTMVEPNKVLRDFTQYRWEWTKGRVPTVDRYGSLKVVDKLPRSGEFEVVIALDVFEHIHADELPKMLKKIGKMVPERGRMFHHNNWEQQDLFPFHFNHSQEWEGWLRKAGFYPLEPPFVSLKIK